MSKSVHFFAVEDDLNSLLTSIERKASLLYTPDGLNKRPSRPQMHTGTSLPALGTALYGDQMRESSYLVVERNTEVQNRPVAQRSGGVLYVINQSVNPNSVVFVPGGQFKDKCIIAGTVGTCTQDPTSIKLLSLFRKEIRKQFKRIHEYWVGPEAEKLLDRGYRLTANITAPRNCDLRRT